MKAKILAIVATSLFSLSALALTSTVKNCECGPNCASCCGTSSCQGCSGDCCSHK